MLRACHTDQRKGQAFLAYFELALASRDVQCLAASYNGILGSCEPGSMREARF